ncbi:MAG: ribonuclease R [Salibacteraceae bacterium]
MSKQSPKKLSKHVKKLRNHITRYFQENPKALVNHKQLAAHLRISDGAEKQILIAVIESMIKDGLLAEEPRGKYQWKGPLDELEGIISFNRSGNAFVEIQGLAKDVMIPEQFTGRALHGDLVAVRLLSGRKGSGRVKGKVIKIIERARETFPAVIFEHENRFYAMPDNPKISVDFFIPSDNMNGAKVGEKVVVKLLNWDNVKLNPLCEVTEVLGMPGDMKAEGDAILAQFGFPLRFPEEVEQESHQISPVISKEEIAKRRDFRDVLTFTIDPADAKDFDDAISFQTLNNNHFEIGVHIADVTHYVSDNSALEKEARNRATSVYLVDRVIPMLPEVLSNKLCSLRPKEEKLTFSCVFEMDKGGAIHNTWIGKTVIYSDHRFVYEDVQDILEKGSGLYSDELQTVNSIAKILRQKRLKSGAIAFEKTEVKFNLDENKKPIEVIFKVQKDAHKLVEEFMLLANKAVAMQVGKKEKTGDHAKTYVYRIHDNPDPTKIKEFADFIKRFGYRVDLSTPEKIAAGINDLLVEVKGKPEQNIVEMLAIRTMAKAEYSTQNIGHFGLSFPFYSHFTSPIRRYPDMIAHRLMQRYLEGGSSADQTTIEKLCKHSGIMERKATEAERESTKLYQVIFMQDHVGEVMDGIVSGVTEWGVFVEIVVNKSEGLVRLRDIKGDYYFFDQKNMEIVGQRTKRSYTLGQNIKVKIDAADLENRRIDLSIVD